MKKIYTLLLGALVAGTATAALPTASIKNAESVNKAMEVRTRAVEGTMHKAPAKASEYDSYTWVNIGTGHFLDSVVESTYGETPKTVEVTVLEAQEAPGVYKLMGVWPTLVSNGSLIIDATDPNFVMVPAQYTGIDDTEDGMTYIASINAVYYAEGYTAEEISTQMPDLIPALDENNTIQFPATCMVLNWPDAPSDSKWNTDPNQWYYGSEDPGYLVLPGGEYVDPWTLAENGEFVENIVSYLFSLPERTEATALNVYYNETSKEIKVEDPFRALYDDLGLSAYTSPEMILDVTNPENVLIELQSTGIQDPNVGTLGYFSESWYYENYAEIGDVWDDSLTISMSEDNDGNCIITIPYHATSIFAAGTGDFYYGSGYVSTISFTKKSTGVSNIAASENGEAVYYNLQGVRVNNPSKGIVIRVQDGKASKVCF